MLLAAAKDDVLLKRTKIPFFAGVAFFLFQFLAESLTALEQIAGATIRFYDLTLPLISALLVLYRMKALPILGVFFLYSYFYHPLPDTLTLSSQLLAALISQLLYYLSTGKRGAVSFGRSQLTAQRIGWLVCCNSVLYALFHHCLQANFDPESVAEIFTVQRLINVQWMMNSCITGIPFCYLLLRICHKPAWGLMYFRQVKESVKSGPSIFFQVAWWLLLLIITYCLISKNLNTLLFTDYSLLWLLPVMLWGTVRIGHALVAPVWVIILILLGNYIDGYISIANTLTDANHLHSLIISSTTIFIFSLTIVATGVISSRSKKYSQHVSRLYRAEPNTGLLNFQALSMDMDKHSAEALCLIRCPELNELEQTYGVEFRFEFVKALSAYIANLLSCCDRIYYSPGHGLIIRLNNSPDIPAFYRSLRAFRFQWKTSILGLNCGVAYTSEKRIIRNLSEAIKQLNINSYISLLHGRPLSLSPTVPGDNIVESGMIRDVLQQAIDKQSLMLMAQPIVSTMLTAQPVISVKGKFRYHEILIRLKTADEKLIFPDTFLPLARKGGLLPALDITVIEQTFRFMQTRKGSDPDCYFSINLTPESLHQTDFLDNVSTLFKKYSIAPYRIIFEIIESEILDNDNVSEILRSLRNAGCKIAIDDFGTGSSSYERLRMLNADILKIDGSFIKNIINDPFSYCAVKSFCEMAKLKNMEIVAEFVENEEIAQMLTSMGIDWLQGYHIGKPVPVELAEL
ncbi:EAL domain-containing protein [Buttiauxella gaviniae]|uniref:EAL domain-containing protein n=1 Tax=Buttiauxella gaviniae TaxID=82990 RepID=A0ABV3NR34_9ENTR